MPKVFHLLTESEPFSEHRGGAISRWVANVLRPDENGIVVAPSADRSWDLPVARVRVLPMLLAYRRLMQYGGHRLPWRIKTFLLQQVLRSALQDLEPGDIVWVHNRPEFVLALQSLVHGRGASIVLQLHNSHLVQWSRRVTEAITPDCYIFVTRFLEDEARLMFPKLGRTAITYSGADTSIFHPSATSRPTSIVPSVLFVGRLVPDKGVHVLVAAMKLLEQRRVSLHAMIVGSTAFGSDSSSPYIEQLHRDAPSSVSFAPYCSGTELGDIFRRADIVCVPSCWNEALGLVVLEGMASGLPIVATRSGGMPELLAEGGGLLIQRNDPKELADALEVLARDPVLRHRLGAEARWSLQRNFTWEHVRQSCRTIVMDNTRTIVRSHPVDHSQLALEPSANV